MFAYTDRRAALQSASSCTLLNGSLGVCYVRFTHIYASPCGADNTKQFVIFVLVSPGVSDAHGVRIYRSPCEPINDKQLSFI